MHAGSQGRGATARPARRPWRPLVQVLAPLAAALVIALVIAVFGLFLATSQSDAVSVDRQIRVVQHAIDTSIDDLALQQETVAAWDDSAAELAKPVPSQYWLHNNVSSWLHDTFGHDEVFILDGNDRPIHAVSAARFVPLGRYRALERDLKPLIDGVRGRIDGPNGQHDRNPGRALAPDSSVLTSARTTHDSHLLLVGGRPAAASAMLIEETTPGWFVPNGPRPVLVSVRYLDGNFLAEMAARNLIEAPRFSRSNVLREGEQDTLLRSESGRPIGYLIWRPELPGSRIFGTLAPATVVLALFMAALMGVLARRLIQTTNDLARAEAASAELARRDALTGLPNRALLNERLAAIAEQPPRSLVALLLVDLDRFKQVNDMLGHQAGDALLVDFARRLTRLSGPADTVARLGGDEFALLVHGRSRSELERFSAAILEAAARPFALSGTTAHVAASIGVATVPRRGCGAEELTRRADVALYAAKGDGRACARFFSTAMDAQVRERAIIEDDLRRAIALGGLEVWYQPQVLRDGRIIGLEALLRWQHPSLGMVSPDLFIRIAEDAGMIGEIGDWAIHEVAATAARWPHLKVAANISPVQFRNDGFAERAIAIFKAAGVDPARIELEVTERLLLDTDARIVRQIATLRRAGFRLALDDFGTGYSSLSYLQRFRVDTIKIDRSFVGCLSDSPDSRAIVAAIINLGEALGVAVTAEGVETAAQLELLVAGGCAEFQGHYFWPACPASEIKAILTQQGAVAPPAAHKQPTAASLSPQAS